MPLVKWESFVESWREKKCWDLVHLFIEEVREGIKHVPAVNWLRQRCIANSVESRLVPGLQSSNPVLFPLCWWPWLPTKFISHYEQSCCSSVVESTAKQCASDKACKQRSHLLTSSHPICSFPWDTYLHGLDLLRSVSQDSKMNGTLVPQDFLECLVEITYYT